MTKPTASLSLDLDDKWAYLRTHGVPSWASYPTYLQTAVPRLIDCCAAHDLRLTCMVIGRDAAREEHTDLFAALADAGHEIGNHTLNHYPWFHTLSRTELEAEIATAEVHIERATGQQPIGFRGPSYAFSQDLFDILAQRGYWYDASSLPTFVGPPARWFFRHSASRDAVEEAERCELFGSFSEGWRSNKPYLWSTAAGPLLEIPVTTFPIVRLPIHTTYLFYLSQFSSTLARTYFRFALWTCRVMNVEPSLLLHPLDVLGLEDEPELRFMPSMMVPKDEKLELLSELLSTYAAAFHVVPLREHARRARQRLGVAPVSPSPLSSGAVLIEN